MRELMAMVFRLNRIFSATVPVGFRHFRLTGLALALSLALPLGLGFLQPAFALNAIHEASYNLIPRGNFKSATTLSAGAILNSKATSIWAIPLAIALKATPRVELGARLQTQWGDVQDHIPYLVFGAKWLTVGQTSVQADLLVGANRNAGKGFSLSSHHKFNHTSWFYGRLAPRLGFMEALVEEDALAAMEVAYHPTLVIARSIRVECGLIGSSQSKNFEKYLAIDLQPAVHVNFGRASELAAAVAMGLAGNRKEEMRVKVIINHGI